MTGVWAGVILRLMREKIGKLNCLRRPGEDDSRTVVLLHGFGADASDLFPLADFLDPDERWNFVFPEAPLEVPLGPMMTGRGWFPISVREMEGKIDFSQARPPHMDASCDLIFDMLFHINAEKCILGGFSQGAMIAVEVALNNPEDIAGLILLSGTLLDEKNWMQKAPLLKGKPFLQSHGMKDPVLPFALAQRLFKLLQDAGLEGGFVPFAGGHEIPLAVLQKTKEFLNLHLE